MDLTDDDLWLADEPGLVNCVMLIKWPERREMIQHAVLSFAAQDYEKRALTIVNDGAPCALSPAWAKLGLRATIVSAPAGSSIGEKRNLATKAMPSAEFIASFDDDDFSLPSRLRTHVERIGRAAWLSASRKYISLHTLDNVIGFEHGRCYGAGMIRAEVARELPWEAVSYREDQRLYEEAKAHPGFSAMGFVEADDLAYVHRRHETNASAAHRENLWQGVLPLQLGGAEALAGVETLKALLAKGVASPYVVDGAAEAGAHKPAAPAAAPAAAMEEGACKDAAAAAHDASPPASPAGAHPVETAMAAMQADTPRISDAMKNYCSVLAGNAAGAADTAFAPPASAASASSAPPPPPPRYELRDLLDMAKVALKAINDFELPEPAQWNVLHPQADDESGTSRMDALARYRAATLLAARCREAASAPSATPAAKAAKATKLLGRGWLRATRCWEGGARDAAAAALGASARRFEPATVDAFLDGWGAAILADGGAAGGEGGGTAADADLIWATDFNAAVLARRKARVQEVKERRERMTENSSDADALRAAMRAEAPADETETGEDGEEEDDEDEDEDDGPRVIEVDVSAAGII